LALNGQSNRAPNERYWGGKADMRWPPGHVR
jgi:hypothetical protein